MKEQLQEEAQKIQNEKERLLALDEKGLMEELILAIRGIYSQIENIQIQQAILSDKIENIESDIRSIQEDISDIVSKWRILTKTQMRGKLTAGRC